MGYWYDLFISYASEDKDCEVFEKRIEGFRDFLHLPESPDVLLRSIASWGVFESYWAETRPRPSRKKAKTAR
jgi:hypothetical protein